MKKVITLVVLSLLMAGCVSNDKIAVTPEQLQHYRSVSESVNGKPVTNNKDPPEISLGKKMMISGNMCNRFSSEGKLFNGELTAKGLAVTRMICANPQFSELDNTISEMPREGARADLTANQLTLATAKQTPTHKLADLMNQQLSRLLAASDCSLQRSLLGNVYIPIVAPSS